MRHSWLPSILLACALAAAVVSAQTDTTNSSDLADRIAALDQRVAAIEKALTERRISEAARGGGASESRLNQIETRLTRLENTSTSLSSGGLSDTRLLESRIRTLEQEVMRLRR